MDTAVESFSLRVGDVVGEVGQDIAESLFDHLGDFHNRLQLRTNCPVVPFMEIVFGRSVVTVAPEVTEALFDGPCTTGL